MVYTVCFGHGASSWGCRNGSIGGSFQSQDIFNSVGDQSKFDLNCEGREELEVRSTITVGQGCCSALSFGGGWTYFRRKNCFPRQKKRNEGIGMRFALFGIFRLFVDYLAQGPVIIQWPVR